VLPAVRAKYWNINAQGRFPFEKPVKFYSLDQINQAAQDSEKGGHNQAHHSPISGVSGEGNSMSQVTNLAFFPARGRYSSRCADVFILYFPNKTRRICSGSFSYNMGPLLGREGVAQNIPSGRDDFLESPVGNAHRDSQNVNLIRLVLDSAVQ
jgi:hypothetical protein